MASTARCGNGCDRRVYARGYCWNCYRRAHYNGEIVRPNARRCIVDGCTLNVYSNGMCGRHFSSERYRKVYAVGVRSDRPQCAYPDCARPRYARGWCKTHYQRWYEENH